MISAIGSAMDTYAASLSTAVGGAAPARTAHTARTAQATEGGTGQSFADVFQSAVSSVDSLQKSADQQITGMLTGTGDADLNKVTVSVEKADVAFQLMLQVRNKVVGAYQEMEKMQF